MCCGKYEAIKQCRKILRLRNDVSAGGRVKSATSLMSEMPLELWLSKSGLDIQFIPICD